MHNDIQSRFEVVRVGYLANRLLSNCDGPRKPVSTYFVCALVLEDCTARWLLLDLGLTSVNCGRLLDGRIQRAYSSEDSLLTITSDIQQRLTGARELAQSLGHSLVGTEHLLSVLIHERLPLADWALCLETDLVRLSFMVHRLRQAIDCMLTYPEYPTFETATKPGLEERLQALEKAERFEEASRLVWITRFHSALKSAS
ncbi:hypothetical protein EDM80_13255 [bacterium]|nr:MAG: hypothetical protein EDM80_13255 [bacterium]RIK59679.1 MAG: hypothetical protein DCC64_15575 [Planctomycetota bacterium]